MYAHTFLQALCPEMVNFMGWCDEHGDHIGMDDEVFDAIVGRLASDYTASKFGPTHMDAVGRLRSALLTHDRGLRSNHLGKAAVLLGIELPKGYFY